MRSSSQMFDLGPKSGTRFEGPDDLYSILQREGCVILKGKCNIFKLILRPADVVKERECQGSLVHCYQQTQL